MDQSLFTLDQSVKNLAQIDNRCFIKITGEDRFSFLQGLITNDVYKLESQPLVYSCFLTAQGKYLFDFFLFLDEEAILLDLKKEHAQSFFKKLRIYKLRSKVAIELLENQAYRVLYSLNEIADREQFLGGKDPRREDLGYRYYVDEDMDLSAYHLFDYEAYRYAKGIVEGSQDLIQDKSTMQEGFMDELGAVDYKKGCYIGQELTARIHYRGLLKKQLIPFSFKGEPQLGEVISLDGKEIGEVRSFYTIKNGAGYGFALMRLKENFKEQNFSLENSGSVISF